MKEKLIEYVRIILNFYSSLGKEKVFKDNRYCNGNSDSMVYSRLERAAFNQADGNASATCSRYAIWAADVREIMNSAIEDINNNELDKAKEKMILALNALGAYIDIQSLFDAQPGGMQFDTPRDIIKRYDSYKMKK